MDIKFDELRDAYISEKMKNGLNLVDYELNIKNKNIFLIMDLQNFLYSTNFQL